ncbi:unnamed protein product [Ambrosiozyma monospora]|uniref:Unnamed protein product n=1 Tax=Ambrosiozyma monospora TaxID=43982 RepID=A0ACB5T191_AMBMO|nr:unnamed protein product [Ambrosiozyma monospora]
MSNSEPHKPFSRTSSTTSNINDILTSVPQQQNHSLTHIPLSEDESDVDNSHMLNVSKIDRYINAAAEKIAILVQEKNEKFRSEWQKLSLDSIATQSQTTQASLKATEYAQQVMQACLKSQQLSKQAEERARYAEERAKQAEERAIQTTQANLELMEVLRQILQNQTPPGALFNIGSNAFNSNRTPRANREAVANLQRQLMTKRNLQTAAPPTPETQFIESSSSTVTDQFSSNKRPLSLEADENDGTEKKRGRKTSAMYSADDPDREILLQEMSEITSLQGLFLLFEVGSR